MRSFGRAGEDSDVETNRVASSVRTYPELARGTLAVAGSPDVLPIACSDCDAYDSPPVACSDRCRGDPDTTSKSSPAEETFVGERKGREKGESHHPHRTSYSSHTYR